MVCGFLWWSTRLSRAIGRVVAFRSEFPRASSAGRIPDDWVPDLALELIRDETGVEALHDWIQGRLPSGLIPAPFRYAGGSERRMRALGALAYGRKTEELLGVLVSAYPKAPPNGAQWVLGVYAAMSPPGYPGRCSLFHLASRNPDPVVRVQAIVLLNQGLGTGVKQSTRDAAVRARLRELMEDQVSVVREAARKALAELEQD